MDDSKKKSLIKVITWRFIATSTTMGLVYVATGESILALGVGGAGAILKMVFYYLHERMWNNILIK